MTKIDLCLMVSDGTVVGCDRCILAYLAIKIESIRNIYHNLVVSKFFLRCYFFPIIYD